jgi:DNA primase catalytic core
MVMPNRMTGRVSSEWIEELKQKVSLVEVVQKDEPELRRQGQEWVSGHDASGHGSEGEECLHIDDKKGLGLWHCFHCGQKGDVIDWIRQHHNLSFVEAIDWLCLEFSIEMPDESPEKRQARQERSQERQRVRAVMQDVFGFYRSQLRPLDRQYLQQRGINNQTIDELMIGYAPAGGCTLRSHFKEQHTESDLLSTGLLNQTEKGIFDHYQDRIVFPYWFRQEIVYSIARLPTDDKAEIKKRHPADRAKYKKHLISSQGRPYISSLAVEHVIYGQDSIRSKNQIVVTEGIVDAILAVQEGWACLSPTTTQPNRDQIAQLVKLTQPAETVYVINDNDEAGLKGALGTMDTLFLNDQDVRLVQLPPSAGAEKVDLADYLQEHNSQDLQVLMDAAPDYIGYWLQQIKDLEGQERTTQLADLIKRVFSVKRDPVTQEWVKEQFTKSKLITRSVLSKQIKLVEEKSATKAKEDQGGYTPRVIEAESYYLRTGLREEVISSFRIKPGTRIWVDGQEHIKADFITTDKTYPNVLIERRDWNSNDRFMDVLPSLDLQWRGKLGDVQDVLSIISDYETENKQGTSKLGYHPSGVWILPNGQAFDANGRVENPDIVYLPLGGRGELDDKLQINELDDDRFQSLFQDCFQALFQLNIAEVVVPMLGWFMATPFKALFSLKQESFPLLSVVGTRGAGKSTILRLMWRLMGFRIGDEGKLFSCTDTEFVQMKLLSSTSTIPIIFDEYKPYDMQAQRVKGLHRMLRRTYDGERAFRGRSDQSTVEYSLTAPVAVAGEQSLQEGALLERVITVQMSPNDLNTEMKAAYQQLQRLDLSAFMGRYISFCLSVDFDSQLQVAEDAVAQFIETPIPDRVRKNLVAMTFGFNQLVQFALQQQVEVTNQWFEDLLGVAIETITQAVVGEDGVTKVALDHLIRHLATMAELGKLESGVHYKVRAVEGDLALRLDPCLAEYRRYHRETQLEGELLNYKAYRQQINENYQRGGYVTHTSMNVDMNDISVKRQQKRCVVISFERAGELEIDLDGFRSY